MSWPSRSTSRGWRWPSGAVCMLSCRPSSTPLQPIGSQEASANQRAASTLALVTGGPRGKWDLRGFLWTKRGIVRCRAHMHYPIFLPQDCQTWGADSGRESRGRLLVVPAWRAIDKCTPPPWLSVRKKRGRRCISTLQALRPGYFGVLAMISDDSSCYSTWKSMSVGHGVIWTQTSIGDSLSYFTESGYQESDLKDKVANPKCRKQNLQSVHFPTVFIYWSKVDSKGTLLIVASSKASRLSDLTCNFQANTMKLEWYM